MREPEQREGDLIRMLHSLACIKDAGGADSPIFSQFARSIEKCVDPDELPAVGVQVSISAECLAASDVG